LDTTPILITCPRGAAPYLAREVEALGLPINVQGESSVMSAGTMDDAMRLNLHLRTAHRVLVQLQEFKAADPDQLYNALMQIEWERYIFERGYLSVTSTVNTPTIINTTFANQRVKDAVVDRLVRETGFRPDSGPRRDRSVVHLYWKDEEATVYLDTSGDPISRRGYRREQGAAPMGEALAAAVVMAAGWTGQGAFVNPMCGSGTLAIEAALLAIGKPPGILRMNFGFMHLKTFDKRRWEEIKRDALHKKSLRLPGPIVATDADRRVLGIAKRNAGRAGVEHLIEFKACDFADTPLPKTRSAGVVVMNPEYGARMGDEQKLEPLYGRIGDFFKQHCAGYTGYIFTGNPRLAKRVGLRTSSRETFYNGPIECRLLKYELYEGSRK
jgi:23S rRNA G2445 N2-methylase RlmL